MRQLVAISLLLTMSVPVYAQLGATRKVAITGDIAPGTNGARIKDFDVLTFPNINESGDIGFLARLITGENGVTNNNDGVSYREVDGTLELLMRQGMTAPDLPGETIRALSAPAIDNLGGFAIQGKLKTQFNVTDTTNDSVLYSSSGGVPVLLAREGSLAPGTGSGRFGELSNIPRLGYGSGGHLSLVAKLQTGVGGVTINSDGVRYVGLDGQLELIAREGAVAPQTGGARFEDTGSELVTPVVTSNGSTVFQGRLRTGQNGVTSSTDGVIYKWSDNSLSLVAREGFSAPVQGGANFHSFNGAMIGESGQVAFLAKLRTGINDITSENDDALFMNNNGTSSMIAREGFDAPGTGGADFDRFTTPAININGDLAFNATLQTGESGVTDLNNSGLFQFTNDELELIAREGGDAVNTGGALFGDFNTNQFTAQNNNGDLAFTTRLALGVGGVTEDNDEVLYAYDSLSEELLLVARSGDLFDVNSDPLLDDFRQIESILFDAIPANGVGLTDNRMLAYRLNFTDGSEGIFVTNLSSVPEPSSILVLAGFCVMVSIRRRRIA